MHEMHPSAADFTLCGFSHRSWFERNYLWLSAEIIKSIVLKSLNISAG